MRKESLKYEVGNFSESIRYKVEPKKQKDMKIKGKAFFKVGEILFCVNREQPETSHGYRTSIFKLYKMKEAERVLINIIGLEKAFHPNGIVRSNYEGTLFLESLEQDKLITESEALALAKKYAKFILS